MFPVALKTTTVIILALVAVVCWALGKRWFRKDEAKEDRQRQRNAVVRILETAKLPLMADILECVVVEDWSGLLRECISLRKSVKDEAALLVLLENNFWYQVDARMKMPEQQAKIIALVDELADAAVTRKAREREALIKELEAEGCIVTKPSFKAA